MACDTAAENIPKSTTNTPHLRTNSHTILLSNRVCSI